MDSLPMQFVSSMKTLFNIMDDKHTGYVNIQDIKHRWRHDRTNDLPRGVIESLQKVASHDGLLSFENFCTGLKICLLQNQVEKAAESSSDKNCNRYVIETKLKPQSRLPSFDENVRDNENIWQHLENASQKQQASHQVSLNVPDDNHLVAKQEYFDNSNTHQISVKLDRHNRLQMNNSKNIESADFKHNSHKESNRGLADGKSSLELQLEARRRRRLEPRRHTLHNGIDYNLLKRMKQIEQEKELLLLGLTAIEEARDWYIQQLADVQEKMRYAGRMGVYVEPWSEAHQERLELLKVRILEINRQLHALASGWRHGQLSLHMNLAVPSTLQNHSTLTSQNQLLNEEINKKNQRILVLETEKSALIRKVLMQQNKKNGNDNHYD